MPIFHTAILLYDKKQYAIPAIATEQESQNKLWEVVFGPLFQMEAFSLLISSSDSFNKSLRVTQQLSGSNFTKSGESMKSYFQAFLWESLDNIIILNLIYLI